MLWGSSLVRGSRVSLCYRAQLWRVSHNFGERARAMGSDCDVDRERGGGESVRRERGHWDDIGNQKRFLEDFAASKGFDVSSTTDWERVTVREVRDFGGRGLLGRYGNSLRRTLADLYPSLSFSAAQQRKPNGYWGIRANRRQLLDSLAQEKGISDVEGWRAVTTADVLAAGGHRMLAIFNYSVHALLEDTYPELDMRALYCRPRAPNGFWDSRENRKEYVESLAKILGVNEPKDWRHVTSKQVQELGGSRLLERYNSSLAALLEDVYPELRKQPPHSFRAKAKQHHWASLEEQRRFLDQVAEKYHVRTADDWAKVGTKEICDMGGSGLLSRYSGIFACLRSVYGATYKGMPLTALGSTSRLPVNFWQEDENVRAFIRLAEERLAITEPSQWYRISSAQMAELRGSGLRRSMPLIDALRIAHPTFPWDQEEFSGAKGRRKKSSQRSLLLQLENIFANAQQHPHLAN